MSRRSSRRKLAVEVRRRGWLVALVALLVLAVAFGVSRTLPSSSRAEAILVVRAAGPLAEQPSSSTKLAATYASLIPLDAEIQDAVERALPTGEDWSFATSNDPNTALLRLTFSAPSSGEAIDGARIVARAISGPTPVSRNITPNAIAVARLPDSADESSLKAQLLAVAAILGLLLGAVLVSFWRSRDARVDTLPELRELASCPCFAVDVKASRGLRPLFDALVDSSGRSTAVTPCRPRDMNTAAALCQMLINAFGPGRFSHTGAPGSTEAGELAAASADTVVLVLSVGTRAADVEATIDILDRYRAAPAYAILAQGGSGPDEASTSSSGESEALPAKPVR